MTFSGKSSAAIVLFAFGIVFVGAYMWAHLQSHDEEIAGRARRRIRLRNGEVLSDTA